MARNTNTDTCGTTNQHQTRKWGESDPNEPPKRRKTHHSNPDSEIDEADQPEVEWGYQTIERWAVHQEEHIELATPGTRCES